MGWRAAVITGDSAYYSRFGFVAAHALGIHCGAATPGAPKAYLLVLELKPGSLSEVTGTFFESECYTVKDGDVEAFDASFPPREKRKKT